MKTAAPSESIRERFAARARAEDLLDVAYAFHDTPFGPMLLARTARGLIKVALKPEWVDDDFERLTREVSPRIIESPPALDTERRQLDEYFDGRRHEFSLDLDRRLIHGFGVDVLDVTYAIPFGQTLSYGDVAERAGRPHAQRAAGTALGNNPIPIVIPCHRVVRSDGSTGNYGGGPEMKIRLLEHEGAIQTLR
jgi:methylated-DNA-[protein]-cysteine S-methyltransferase